MPSQPTSAPDQPFPRHSGFAKGFVNPMIGKRDCGDSERATLGLANATPAVAANAY